jgi:hypothetical protein
VTSSYLCNKLSSFLLGLMEDEMKDSDFRSFIKNERQKFVYYVRSLL